MTKQRWAILLQACGLGAVVVGVGLLSVAVAFVVGGVGLVLWGVSVEREDSD
jgi:hypothetical protein